MTSKISFLVCVAALAFAGCRNHSESAAIQAFETLNSALKKYEEPSQFFTVSAEGPSKVKGKMGTVIWVNPSDLITEQGKPVGDTIVVELKELVNQSQLLRTGAQTVSNGRLLVSGGAYFIQMRAGGEPLKLKEGASLKVEFPKLTESKMSLFYGQRDSLGAINWQQANEKFRAAPKDVPKKETRTETTKKMSDMELLLQHIAAEDSLGEPMSKAEREKLDRIDKMYNKSYGAIALRSFGWINCDRFLEMENTTGLQVNFNPADNIPAASVFLVFKDINSVMQYLYHPLNAQENIEAFRDIPVGYKVRLVAISIKDETFYSYAVDMTIGKMQTLTLPMRQTSDAELDKLFDIAAK